jgi:hypothetical protein
MASPVIVVASAWDGWYVNDPQWDSGTIVEKGVTWECEGYVDDLFAIDNLFGSFSFSNAKAIDFVWNIVVGHGIQFLMTWTSYRVIIAALLRTTESVPVSYNVFAALSFSSSKPDSLIPLLKATWKTNGWRAKFTMGWVLYATAWIIAVPAVLDGSTGYAQQQETMVILQDGTMFPYINCTTVPHTGPILPTHNHGFFSTDFLCGNQTLNVFDMYDANTLDPRFPPFACASTQSYEWGFSTYWMLAFACLNGIWVLGTYVLWIDTKRASVLGRMGRKAGGWRAILDLAGAISTDLGVDLAAYSNDELAKELDERPPIKYYDLENRVTLSSRNPEQVVFKADSESDVR